jgi:hypothetical protein
MNALTVTSKEQFFDQLAAAFEEKIETDEARKISGASFFGYLWCHSCCLAVPAEASAG